MRRHVGALRWVVAGVLCLVGANAAWAHVAVKSTGNHRQVNMITTTPGSIIPLCPAGPPCSTFLGTVVWPEEDEFGPAFAPDPWTVFHSDRDTPFIHRTYVGSYFDNTGGAAANKVQVTAIAIGEGSQAGRLQGSIYLPPDTAFAGVGLYGPGPVDSMLIAIVDRSSPSNLGIHFSNSSALQVRSLGNSHEQPRSTLKMLVYEDEAAANADPNQLGVGAKFNGTVILDGSAGTLKTQGGFAQSDWFLVNNGGGKYTARPSPGLLKNVPVSSSTNAVLVVVADPVIAQATPGASPIILILIALALAGAGVWAIRRRPGAQLA